MGTMHESLAMNEFIMCNVDSLPTDSNRTLVAKIKESDHLWWIDLEKDMNDEQNDRLKHFSSCFLTSQKWDKDHILSSNNN